MDDIHPLVLKVAGKLVPVAIGGMAADVEFLVNQLRDSDVPFVNRPFESEIHGTVNFTQFCCVLLITWCYCVLLSCYLRPK